MYDLSSKIHVGRLREDSDGGRGSCVASYLSTLVVICREKADCCAISKVRGGINPNEAEYIAVYGRLLCP